MIIYAVRHGHTNYNRRKQLNSDPSVNVRLTQKGIEQAETAGQSLKDKDIELIIRSDMPRTKQTAEIINKELDLDIEVIEQLNDIKTGMDGWPVLIWWIRRWFNRDHPEKRYGKDGESLNEAAARVQKAIDGIVDRQEKTILIVAHKHTIHQLQARFKGQPGSAQNADIHVFDTTKAQP